MGHDPVFCSMPCRRLSQCSRGRHWKSWRPAPWMRNEKSKSSMQNVLSCRGWTTVLSDVFGKCCTIALDVDADQPGKRSPATIWHAARQAGPKYSKKSSAMHASNNLPNFWTSSTLSQKTCYIKLPNQTDCTDCSPNHLNEIILLLC